MHDIEYYDDSWDSSCFFVCIDKYYIFAADRKSKYPKWEFIHPRSVRWDAVHQRIYRNGRADKISREDLPANFPPPPDSIPPEAINLPPLPKQAPLLAETYPAVAKHLSTLENKSVEIYVVLVEDLYESEVGDGKFHYPDCIFLDEATAQEYCSKNKNDNDDYHLRKCRLTLDDAAILCEIFKQSFDHIGGLEVLKLMNEKLDELSP
jgi:hypothetical protein